MMSDKEMKMTASEFVDYLRAEGKDYAYITGVLVAMIEQNVEEGELMDTQMRSFRRYREEFKTKYPQVAA